MSKTAQIIIKSCDRRVLELEQVKAWLTGNGFQLSGNHFEVDPKADLIILTTCGVTQLHEDFTFEMLDQIMARKKPAAAVILGGCVPEINPKRVSEEFDGPTFSPKSYHKLDEILNLPQKLECFDRPNTYRMHGLYRSDVGNMLATVKYVTGLDLPSMMRGLKSRVHNRRTYYIQIHEGCSMGCTYCAIQKAIGPLRNSKPIEAVVAELNEGIAKGYRRIRLIGDCAGSYGLDIGTNLGNLLQCIAENKNHFSLELTDINPVFLPVIYRPVKELCLQKRLSNLYIPIQSGNARILGLMNRRCDIDETRQMLIDLK
ncbi:MAG: radical SAM protein, partial [Firmicutes bacterium]|nr:radical SAM protein [Bacillota bacterium]